MFARFVALAEAAGRTVKAGWRFGCERWTNKTKTMLYAPSGTKFHSIKKALEQLGVRGRPIRRVLEVSSRDLENAAATARQHGLPSQEQAVHISAAGNSMSLRSRQQAASGGTKPSPVQRAAAGSKPPPPAQQPSSEARGAKRPWDSGATPSDDATTGGSKRPAIDEAGFKLRLEEAVTAAGGDPAAQLAGWRVKVHRRPEANGGGYRLAYHPPLAGEKPITSVHRALQWLGLPAGERGASAAATDDAAAGMDDSAAGSSRARAINAAAAAPVATRRVHTTAIVLATQVAAANAARTLAAAAAPPLGAIAAPQASAGGRSGSLQAAALADEYLRSATAALRQAADQYAAKLAAERAAAAAAEAKATHLRQLLQAPVAGGLDELDAEYDEIAAPAQAQLWALVSSAEAVQAEHGRRAAALQKRLEATRAQLEGLQGLKL